jgi:hypothetical protein
MTTEQHNYTSIKSQFLVPALGWRLPPRALFVLGGIVDSRDWRGI